MRLAFFGMGPVGGGHMRLLLFATGVFVVVMCAERPAEAQNYPWCAYYGPHFGATRVFNISAMPGNYKRDWRELRGESNVSARAEIISVD